MDPNYKRQICKNSVSEICRIDLMCRSPSGDHMVTSGSISFGVAVYHSYTKNWVNILNIGFFYAFSQINGISME